MESRKIRLLVFLCWTFISFACHFCAELFITESAAFIHVTEYNVILLTLLQVLYYIQIVSISDGYDKKAMTHKCVTIGTHACATLATNMSMALTSAASTFAIKLMEPLTSAVSQTIFLKVRLSYLQWISIPAIVSGAIVFANESNAERLVFSKGSVLAFISNSFLSLRNVYMKKNHLSNCTCTVPNISQKSIGVVLSTLSVLIIYLFLNIDIAPSKSIKVYILLLLSSMFHALYSYISMVIVLNHYSVVGHAIGNICKRLAVLCLLYLTGSRTASLTNLIGLSICVIGLAIYAFSNVQEQDNNKISTESDTSFRYMMKSTLLVCTILGIIITIVILWIYHLFGTYEVSISMKKYNSKADVDRITPVNNISLLNQIPFNFNEFYSVNLAINAERANQLSPLLTKRSEVIDEAQRIHMNIFKSVLGGFRYAMLFDFFAVENKGDSAITVGEMLLLRKLNIEVLFLCAFSCTGHALDIAENISRNYSDKELAILLQGGGTMIGYPWADKSRSKIIKRFMKFNIIMFPQSIPYFGYTTHVEFCKKVYGSHSRLTILYRDKVSFNLGKKLFPKARTLLSPDIAYEIGYMPRFMQPTFDILWLKRPDWDKESPLYNIPKAPKGFSMHVSAWVQWSTPRGNSSLEDAFIKTINGLLFLQRGRVVITDRLHGHILASLLNIPVVYIDNKQRKISNYHNIWTAGLDNVVLANSSYDATVKAKELLIKLDTDLPTITGFFK